MSIIMIHGNATNGGGLFDLGEQLEADGYDVKYYKYEVRHFWSYWFKGNRLQDGSSLLHSEEYTEGDDVICHSNGQLVMESAISQGAKFGKVIVFSGAGTSDKFEYPDGSVESVHWFVNVKDKAVWFGALLYKHPFGRAARRGYAGKLDIRQKNYKYNYSKWFSPEHSFWFNSEWMPRSMKKTKTILNT